MTTASAMSPSVAAIVFAVNYLAAINRAFVITCPVNRAGVISAYRAVIVNHTVVIIVILRSFNNTYGGA